MGHGFRLSAIYAVALPAILPARRSSAECQGSQNITQVYLATVHLTMCLCAAETDTPIHQNVFQSALGYMLPILSLEPVEIATLAAMQNVPITRNVWKIARFACQSCINHVVNTNVVNFYSKVHEKPSYLIDFLLLTVNTTTNCRSSDKPVCGTNGQTYASLCHLVKAKATLGYTGRCIESCRTTPVCGMNGISYKSECEAWSGKNRKFRRNPK